MSLGDIVRRRREELKLTQDQVAARIGISKPYLSNIETDRVKNPPTDGVLEGLEAVLQFPPGELRRMAHIVRTPPDVRQEHEALSEEVRRLRGVLKRLLEEKPLGKIGGIDLDAVAEELKAGAGNVSPLLTAGKCVPIINKVVAGYPQDFTDLDYPPSVADEYIRTPDVHDPQAFAARVVGDSMQPDYREGDIVIFAPNTPAREGDDVFARFTRDNSTTFKRLARAEAGEIELRALNAKYPPERHDPSEISGLWPAVMRIEQVRRP